MATLNILLVEDTPSEIDMDLLRSCHASELSEPQYLKLNLVNVANQTEAEKAARKHPWDIVLLDLQYPIGDEPLSSDEPVSLQGMEWLPALRKLQPWASIVILTKHADVKNAVAAIRDHNADEFVSKTESFPVIVGRIQTGWRHARERRRASTLRTEYRSVLRSMGAYVVADMIEEAVQDTATRLAIIAREVENQDPSVLRESPQLIREASNRLCETFTEARKLIGDAREPLQEVDLVEELLDPLHALYELAIDTSTGNGPVTVRTFPDDLKVALHEVVQNSVDTGATSIQVDAQKTASGAVIQVIDNGGGFSPEAEVRKFEAGFSTRKDTKHQGLGLYIARRMIESAGGSLRVENEGAGARVTLTIPNLSGGLEIV